MEKVGVNTLNTLEITTSYILRLVQSRSFVSSSFFLQGQAEVLEVIAQPDMMITGKMLKDLDFPKGVLVSLIYRDNSTIVPTGNTQIKAGDRLISSACCRTCRNWSGCSGPRKNGCLEYKG
ncbi:MAG: hypothetical protein IKT15_00960 [Firmicutes bacterium]|nr:hypothetical protein [Bacillota bacterium]